MSNGMNLPKIARRTDVFELRNAVRAVIGSCKATNKAAVLAVDAAEEAFQASITDDEKAYIVSAARGWKAAWHKSRPDDPFLRGVEFNAYDDVRHHLGMSMVVKFLQDAQSESLAEPDTRRIAGLVLEGAMNPCSIVWCTMSALLTARESTMTVLKHRWHISWRTDGPKRRS